MNPERRLAPIRATGEYLIYFQSPRNRAGAAINAQLIEFFWDDLSRTRKDADAVGDCVVFDIKNKEARLISYIDYEMGTVTVLAVLTHKEYDKGGWKSACNC